MHEIDVSVLSPEEASYGTAELWAGGRLIGFTRRAHAVRRAARVNPTTLPSAGLLVPRLVVGATFLVHGLDKLIDPTGAERFDIPSERQDRSPQGGFP